MGLLQNGFRDKCGIFRTYGAGLSNGALPQQLEANRALTGMRRNLTAGEGIIDDKVGLPMGYLVGGSYQLPQKPGQIAARAYAIEITAQATGVMGLPASGSSQILVTGNDSSILPEDDASPLRSGSALLEVFAEGTGELKVSGSGSALISITCADAELVGVLNASGSAEIKIETNTPILGAIAGGQGEALLGLFGNASILPEDDTSPSRSASAALSLTATGTIRAVGHMVGNALPYTELSPQSLANAVWSATATENNQAGTMGNKLNTASSGGVDLDALAEAVWEYEP